LRPIETLMNKITMIAAATENNALGKDNAIPWDLPDDFKRFNTLTTGYKTIMGRKNFESMPTLLPNRIHIIITRDKNYKVTFDNCIVVHSLEDAIALVANDPLAFIIGGGEIYKQGEKFSNGIELTRIHTNLENADAFFPDIDPTVWKLVSEEHHSKDDRHAYTFTYLTYTRR
jgi:dihydrofolate reductase